MQRVGITGAGGFVGRHITASFLKEGYEVNAYVRRKSSLDFLNEPEQLRIFEGDILNRAALEEFVQSSDVIVHLAAATGGSFEEFRRTTVDGSALLLELAEKHGTKKIICLSSVSILDAYGVPDRTVLDENSRLEPRPELRGAYAHTKLLEDRLFASRISSSALDIVILRAGLIYAANMSSPLLGCGIIRNGWCIVPGYERKHIPFVHVDDLFEALKKAAEKKLSGTYTIVSPDQPEVCEALELYNRISKNPLKVLAVPRSLFSPLKFFKNSRLPYLILRTQNDVRYSPEAARRDLEWTPRVSFEEAMKQAVDFKIGRAHV